MYAIYVIFRKVGQLDLIGLVILRSESHSNRHVEMVIKEVFLQEDFRNHHD